MLGDSEGSHALRLSFSKVVRLTIRPAIRLARAVWGVMHTKLAIGWRERQSPECLSRRWMRPLPRLAGTV